MFKVGDQIRDKRTGEVVVVDEESIGVRWSDGITRDHPLTAAQDTFEVLDATPDPAPAADTAVDEATDGLGGVGTKGVGQADEAGGLAVYRDGDDGLTGGGESVGVGG